MIVAVAAMQAANANVIGGSDLEAEFEARRVALGDKAVAYEAVSYDIDAEKLAEIEHMFNPLQTFFAENDEVEFAALLNKIDFISENSA